MHIDVALLCMTPSSVTLAPSSKCYVTLLLTLLIAYPHLKNF